MRSLGGGGTEKTIRDYSAENAKISFNSNEHDVVTRLKTNVRPDALQVIAGKRLHPDGYKRLCNLDAKHLHSLSGEALTRVSETSRETIQRLNALDSRVLNLLAENLSGNALSGMHKLTDVELQQLNAAALHRAPKEIVEMAKKMAYPEK